MKADIAAYRGDSPTRRDNPQNVTRKADRCCEKPLIECQNGEFDQADDQGVEDPRGEIELEELGLGVPSENFVVSPKPLTEPCEIGSLTAQERKLFGGLRDRQNSQTKAVAANPVSTNCWESQCLEKSRPCLVVEYYQCRRYQPIVQQNFRFHQSSGPQS